MSQMPMWPKTSQRSSNRTPCIEKRSSVSVLTRMRAQTLPKDIRSKSWAHWDLWISQTRCQFSKRRALRKAAVECLRWLLLTQ
jgi:hypothetical protein